MFDEPSSRQPDDFKYSGEDSCILYRISMKQQILKPENWQDFEELSKILWGEIWECPEIKKNGRAGQNQQGVDIYGIPKGETKYYGISRRCRCSVC